MIHTAKQENPTYCRCPIISVVVKHDWLTCDGDYPDTEGGWTELENQLKEAIRRIRIPDVQIDFEGWEGPPEVTRE